MMEYENRAHSRVGICQPLVPKYRTPVFDALGESPSIDLTVFAGGSQGSLQAAADNQFFKLEFDPVINLSAGPLHFCFQKSHLDSIDSDKFDLVILPWDTHYLTLPLSILLSRLRKGPRVALWGHGYSKRESFLRKALRNLYGKMADAVILYNKTIANRLINEHGFSQEKVFVAQNALDQKPIQRARDKWLASQSELLAFQKQYKLNPRCTIAFVSRLEPENRVDMLIRSIPDLKRTHPECKLIIIGDGSDRMHLEALAQDLGIQSSVTFTGAIYDEEQIAPWLLSSTLSCYPQNIGLSILHLFGYGLPVLTSDNMSKQNPEVEALLPGVNGLFYQDGDTENLAEQCRFFFDNPVERDLYSNNAIRRATEEYNLEAMVNGFREVIEWCSTPPGKPSEKPSQERQTGFSFRLLKRWALKGVWGAKFRV